MLKIADLNESWEMKKKIHLAKVASLQRSLPVAAMAHAVGVSFDHFRRAILPVWEDKGYAVVSASVAKGNKKYVKINIDLAL